MNSKADSTVNLSETQRHRNLRAQLREELASLGAEIERLERDRAARAIPNDLRRSARAVLLELLEEHCHKA